MRTCLKRVGGGVILVLLIMSTQGESKVKIRKCCPPDEVIDVSRMKCGDSGEFKWIPYFYKEDASGPLDFEYQIATRVPTCSGRAGVHILPLRKLPLLNIPAVKFRLLQNGKLVGEHLSGNWIDVPEDACIDGIMNYDDSDGINYYTGEEADQAIISCPVIEKTE